MNRTPPLLPGATIGVLGGGQLGRMMAIAARRMGYRVCVLDRDARCPAGQFAEVVGWLALNHGALDVLVHPNTGDALRDHRDCALWLGRSHALNLGALDA